MKHTELIARMTLEEKVSLLSGKDFWETQDIPRLGVPSLFLADGPHGIRRQAVSADQPGLNAGIPATCFPTAATVANSWNVELGEMVGQYLGIEARAQNVAVLLGPGVNMKRNPLCGRNFEYFSEDPYLAGKMAAAYIRGIQSQGVAACVKHFAARNQETRSYSVNVVVDERTLREIYLTAFEIAVKEGRTRALMSSSNQVNGSYANESDYLMRRVLREEWGYQGVVVTDWGGSNDRVAGLVAGNELEMPSNGGQTNRDVADAVRSGRLSEAVVDQAVDRLLTLAGIGDPWRAPPRGSFDVARHHRVTQRVAEESIVLLKNEDGILPLKFGKKVAVVGEFARRARYQGAGSSVVNPTILDHTLRCFEESGIVSIGFEAGFDRYGKKDPAMRQRACALAARADVVLLYLGLDEVSEVQGLDRPTMALPGNQVELLDAIHAVNPNVVVVLSCGSVVEMPWLDKVKGLLHGYLGGQAGARALLRVVSGDVNPSGKLAETYPMAYDDTPSAHQFPGRGPTVEYREGLFIGYRYFDTARVPVRFPFGFGLSYTTFGYADLEVRPHGVSFRLTNTGPVAGMEVAQLYIAKAASQVIRPAKELKGFTKVFLNPGQSKVVQVDFDDKAFRFFNVGTGGWQIEPGDYQILVGASSADLRLWGSLALEGTAWTPVLSATELPTYAAGAVINVPRGEFERLVGYPLPSDRWDKHKVLGHNDILAQCRYAKGLWARALYWGFVVAHRLVWRTGHRSTANLMMMSIYPLPFRGIARMTGGLVTMGMVDGLLTMVNGRFLRGLVQVLRAARSLLGLRFRQTSEGDSEDKNGEERDPNRDSGRTTVRLD